MSKVNLSKKDAKRAQSFPAGTVIFNRGQAGEHMYVILEGTVNVKLGDLVLHTFHDGDFFGEMGIIDNAPRSATAVAQTDCQLVTIDQRQFVFMVKEDPMFAVHVMKALADRLRATNAKLDD